jgi:hypothetical protein
MCSVQFTQGSRLEAVPMTVGPRAAENMGHTAVPPMPWGWCGLWPPRGAIVGLGPKVGYP